MLSTRQARELVVKMPNEIGAFDRLAKTIADRGIDLLAVCAWVEGADAVIRIVTDDSARVVDALRAGQYQVREAEVLVVDLPHKPGMLRHVTGRLADGGVDIHHLYATAPNSQERSLLVFASANNDHAMVLLNAPPVS
jgi:hypothetical protein